MLQQEASRPSLLGLSVVLSVVLSVGLQQQKTHLWLVNMVHSGYICGAPIGQN